jgi:hypothetical protein
LHHMLIGVGSLWLHLHGLNEAEMAIILKWALLYTFDLPRAKPTKMGEGNK